MPAIPQIIDILLLIVILWAAVKGFKSGFATALVDLVGNIVGLIAAWILANKWAPLIFERFFRQNFVDKTYEYIQSGVNTVDVQAVLEEFTGTLPIDFLQEYIDIAGQLFSQTVTPSVELAAQIVDNVIGPVIILVITVALFVAVYGLCNILASLLSKAFKAINHIPVLGFANRMGGCGIGLIVGVFDVILISCILSIIAIITENSLPFINIELLNQSKILALTGAINPFMG